MAFLGELGQHVMVGGRLVKVPVTGAAAPTYRTPSYITPRYVPRQRVAPSLRRRYR